ncbi:MAG: hypothetical protein M3379_02760 [Acidobacteriota bacterium]|nr:hypothetical protein [Acidobacteriota bacterium]
MINAARLLPAFAFAALALNATAARAQHPRPADTQTPTPAAQPNAPKPRPAPPTVKAKYEGGVVGYRKSEGTINFDDANSRLVFRDKNNRELFQIPYKAVVMAWPDTRSQTSTAGRVISAVPYGGLPALLMKSKSRYLNIRYQDPDIGTEGAASFKLGDKDLLYSVLDTLGDKAALTQRGDAYIRPKQTSQTTPTSNP